MTTLLSPEFLSGQVARLAAHPCWRYLGAVARKAVLTDLARVLRSECRTDAHVRLTIGYIVEHLDEYSQFPTVTNLRHVAKRVDPNPTPARRAGCPRCTDQRLDPGWVSFIGKKGYHYAVRCQCSPFFNPAVDVPTADVLGSEEGLAA